VIIVPVIMLVLVALVQMALWARAAQIANVAASEGARAALSVGGGAAAGLGRAQSVLTTSGSGIEAAHVTTSVLACDQVSVTVTGRALSLFPGLSLPVSATQMGPIQEFRASE
jgi:hypothetical protein